MLTNCGLANINALLGQKEKHVTGKWDSAFFQTSNYIRDIFWKWIIVSKVKFQNAYPGDTTHKTPSAWEVETLKLQLSTYNNFF